MQHSTLITAGLASADTLCGRPLSRMSEQYGTKQAAMRTRIAAAICVHLRAFRIQAAALAVRTCGLGHLRAT